LPACISFDFNINPATAVIWQHQHGWVRAWREVWLTHSGGEATRASATAAKALLQAEGWTGEVRIYGDATGTGPKTTGPADHQVVREVFPFATWCIPRANPHVKDRVAAVNARIETMGGERHTTVDQQCRHLIADCEQVIFAEDGQLDKKSNPMLTHISDAWGYGVHREYPPVKPKDVIGVARLPDWI
jgi:hypothetical protein